MAIAYADGYGRGRAPAGRIPAAPRITPASPWGDVYQQWRRPSAPSPYRYLPGRALWPEEMSAYTPPTGPPPLGPPVGGAAAPRVTISVGEPAPAWGGPTAAGVPTPAPAWGGGGGGGGGAAPAPAVPGVSPPGGPAWWNMFQPFFEGAGAPQDLLKLRPQDWRALPREVREQLMAWLRQFGWRPGGAWGRYGAREWQRGEGGQAWAEPGGYVGEQAFGGLPEAVKPWLWFLASQKGWAAPGREKPATQGWSW